MAKKNYLCREERESYLAIREKLMFDIEKAEDLEYRKRRKDLNLLLFQLINDT